MFAEGFEEWRENVLDDNKPGKGMILILQTHTEGAGWHKEPLTVSESETMSQHRNSNPLLPIKSNQVHTHTNAQTNTHTWLYSVTPSTKTQWLAEMKAPHRTPTKRLGTIPEFPDLALSPEYHNLGPVLPTTQWGKWLLAVLEVAEWHHCQICM